MRRTISLSVLGLLVLLALTRYPVPIYRDHTFLHFPVWEVAAQSEGFFFPLSNPYLNHGAPMASDPNHLLLYPTAWLLKILTAQQAYSIHFFGHALLSFWLMAFLLMGRLDRTKTLILSAFWVLSGPFLSASSSLNMFTAFCWVPGILLAAQRASVPGQVLTLSLAALAGEPVIGLGGAALALVYSPNRKRTLVSLGLTALLFLPFFLFLREAFAYSTRMMGGQTWRTALNASLNPIRLPETLLPFLFGVPGTRAGWASFVNPKDFLLPTLGMLWLAFALFEGKRKDWIVLGSLLFLGLGSFNPVVVLLYKGIPQLAWLRFPEKFFLLAAFLLCWRCVDQPLALKWIPWTGLLAVPAFFLSTPAGVLALLSWGTLWLWSAGRPRWVLLPGMAFSLTMVFFTVPVSSDLYSSQKPEREFHNKLIANRVLDLRDPYKIPEEMRQRYRNGRRIGGILFEPPVKEPYYLRRRLLLAPTGMGRRVLYAFAENTSGSGLIYYDMVREVLPGNLDRLAAAYWAFVILDDRGILEVPMVREGEKTVRCVPSAASLIRELGSPAFDPRRTVLLSGDCGTSDITDTLCRHSGLGSWLVEGDGPTVFTWLVAWSPLMKATVDGKPVPVQLANGFLPAVRVPAGRHAVLLDEPVPGSLKAFLFLFYAMLLSVALDYWTNTRLIRGGTPRE
jgi:hypothetical protein